MKRRGKTKVIVNKEPIAESWCFVCKDGGDLRICDFGICLKSYHFECLKKDDSFLASEECWACDWHTCSVCHQASRLQCYTCTNAVCSRCLPNADFLNVKGTNGFCSVCLKLVLLIEENKDYDSDGATVDFSDRETYEGLFVEYYAAIKKAEGFSLDNIYASQNQNKKKKNHQAESYLEEFDDDDDEDDEEDDGSDYDDLEPEKMSKKKHKGKKSERPKSTKRTPVKSNEKGFIGWASRSLVQFLSSIGKSTSERLSQQEVTSIINDYVRENKLYHKEKKRMITCDEHLRRLFKRRTINRFRVYNLLEAHFAENHDDSEDDAINDSGDSRADVTYTCKTQRKHGSKTQDKDLENSVPGSCFASVVIENLKLVYVKRSLLHELLEQPQSFDEKVVGCFVRVKSDPYDYYTKNSHLLRQVKGVKNVSGSGKSTGTILLFSDMPREVHLDLVSDDDFTEEECEDLKRKMLAGQIERLTVVDLQEKVKLLHNDITNHWIHKELAKLRHLIDRANEKGWRYELFEYLEKKKKLQDPSIQSQMLKDVPKVIPEVSEPDSCPENIIADTKSVEESPKSTFQEAVTDGCLATPEPERPLLTTKAKQNGPGDQQPLILYQRMRTTRKCLEASKPEVIELVRDTRTKSGYLGINQVAEGEDSKTWCIGGQNREGDKSSTSVMKRVTEIS